MSIPGKNADLYRRLRLYAFGFVLGMLVVSFVYKGKGCQMPASVKMDELNAQKLEYSEVGKCRMKCLGIADSVVKQILKKGKLNYDESNVHEKPFATYAIESAANKYRFIIADIDTVSRIVNVIDLSLAKDTCVCK